MLLVPFSELSHNQGWDLDLLPFGALLRIIGRMQWDLDSSNTLSLLPCSDIF